MKKFKYIGQDTTGYINLTVGEVYDVIKIDMIGTNYVHLYLYDGDNISYRYSFYDHKGCPYFEDVTDIVRNEIIEDILS